MNNNSFILKDIKEYLVFVSQVKNLSDNTSKSYERDLKKLDLFLKDLKISNYSQINSETCSAWIGSLYSQNNNPRSIQRHLSSAKGFFRFLKKNNLIDSSPFDLVAAPKSSSNLPEVLSPEDVESKSKRTLQRTYARLNILNTPSCRLSNMIQSDGVE